jgi:phage terminase Nu1 subunit (DNA packaging protein)
MKSVNGITSVVNTINPTITVGKFDLLSGVAKTTVEQYFKNGITVKTIGNKLKDILYAEGYRACNFNTSDKSESAVKFHEDIKSIYISQMDESAQDLIKKDPESLNRTDCNLRKLHLADVNQSIANLRKAIDTKDKKSKTVSTGNKTVSGKSVAVTGNNLICRTIMEQIVKLQAIKTPCDKNVEIIKGLQAIVKMFNDCGILVSVKK